MDFFDKLSKKASETYKLTKEKTSQISGELKLRNKMNNSKDRIDELYSGIGKIVYEAHKKNEELSKDDIRPKCEEIAREEEEIEKAEIEILALKKIKKCVNCGAELDEKDEFCSKCGKEQPKEEKIEVEVKESASEGAKEAEVTEVKNVESSNSENSGENNSSEGNSENNSENSNDGNSENSSQENVENNSDEDSKNN